MQQRVFNFGAGPCTLPTSVLEEAADEMLNFKGSGMSVIELSHRSKTYDEVHQQALSLAREVYGVPEDFEVLFIQGGATLQFSMIPMNLLRPGSKAGYVVCGAWAKKAFADGKKYGDVYAAWDGKEESYARMPKTSELNVQPDTRYLHVTSNETIGGIRMEEWPDLGVPLVADMSSDYMSRPIPWKLFDLVYGGVQKNLGPSGMALVFVRRSILADSNQDIGAYLRYASHADSNSLYNTPPVFSIYMMGKVLRWAKDQGGLAALQSRAESKSQLLYQAIDDSGGYYRSPVSTDCRSRMNIVFRLANDDLEAKFIQEATAAGMIGLKGHRSVGGVRASVYNAMSTEGVQALVDFMKVFRAGNA